MRSAPSRPSLVLVAGVLLLVAGCGSDPTTTTTSTGAEPSAAASAAGSPPPAGTSSEPSPAGTRIDVTYAGGTVAGVQTRVPVRLGEQVTLRVTSDVAEEVHLHGYDEIVDVPAGGTAEITFTADLPGSFACELEGLGKQLFQLRVS